MVVQAFHQAFAAQQLVFVQCAASAPGCPKNWLSYVEDGAIVPSPDPSDPTHKKVPRMWIFPTKPWFLGFNIRILGEGISNFREKRGFTSPWILRYPIFRSTQIIDSIQIHSDVPATQAGCFQTFRCCWKVPARFGVVNNFSACSSLMTSRQIGLSTLRRIFTVRRSGPQLCFTQELWT